MTNSTSRRRDDALDASPDGEPRALLARVGDVFPLDSMDEVIAASDEPASLTRPWGLRYARPVSPRAGRHEGATQETTGSGQNDGNSGEDFRRD
jgi:hypothetical protein